jgi:hypothetical protein
MKIKINKYILSIEKEADQPIKTTISEIDSVLPIELIPNKNEVFLKTLLKTKRATITTFFKNGTKESKIWKAERMTANSDVIGNLRSRVEYRNGNWQMANIVKVVVEVNNIFSQPVLEKNKKEISSNTNEITKDTNIKILNNFENYLIENGYSKLTSSGHPSTVYDYMKRVEKICEKEEISLLKIAEKIDFYIRKYDADGIEAEYGNKSHRANINALKRFRDFIRKS